MSAHDSLQQKLDHLDLTKRSLLANFFLCVHPSPGPRSSVPSIEGKAVTDQLKGLTCLAGLNFKIVDERDTGSKFLNLKKKKRYLTNTKNGRRDTGQFEADLVQHSPA